MISDLDIYCAANLVIEQHSPNALIEAARMIDRMLANGMKRGVDWRAISPVPVLAIAMVRTTRLDFLIKESETFIGRPQGKERHGGTY